MSPVSGLMCWRGSERVMLTQLCSLNAIVANSTSFQSLCLLSSHRSLHSSEASLNLTHDLVACDTISYIQYPTKRMHLANEIKLMLVFVPRLVPLSAGRRTR